MWEAEMWQCVRWNKQRRRSAKKHCSSWRGRSDFFSYIGSADSPSVSIATATSHSLTVQSMTHRRVTNKSCNETLHQKIESRLNLSHITVMYSNNSHEIDWNRQSEMWQPDRIRVRYLRWGGANAVCCFGGIRRDYRRNTLHWLYPRKTHSAVFVSQQGRVMIHLLMSDHVK